MPINKHDISVYFKDNVSPPLFSLLDVSRLTTDTNIYVKDLRKIAGKDHCNLLETSLKYSVWCCDFHGFCKILHELMAEQEIPCIVEAVNRFIMNKMQEVPDPLTAINGIEKKLSKNYFSLIPSLSTAVRYVLIDNKRWFAAQDISRLTGKKLSIAEDVFSTIDHNHKLEIMFRNSEVRLCIDEIAVRKFLTLLCPDKGEQITDKLISACKKFEKGVKKQEITESFIVDCTKTAKTRWTIMNLDINKKKYPILFLRYDQSNLIPMYSIRTSQKWLRIKEVNTDLINQAALTDDDIFADIDSLIDILKDTKGGLEHCAEIFSKTVEANCKFDLITITNTEDNLVMATKENLRQRRSDTTMVERKHTFTKTSNGLQVMAYDNVNIDKDHSVIICLAKKDPGDMTEDYKALFWSNKVGSYIDYYRFDRTVNSVCNTEDYCKVTIPDLRKFNAKMVTLAGIEKVLKAIEFKDKEKVLKTLTAVAEKFKQDNLAELNFACEKYNAKKGIIMEEEKRTTEEQEQTVTTESAEEKVEKPIKEEETDKKEETLSYADITFRQQTLQMAVKFDDTKGAIIYYNYKQLCNILGISQDKFAPMPKHKDTQDNETLVSIYYIKDVLDIKTVTELFEESKPTVIRIAESLGMKVKEEQVDKQEVKDDINDTMSKLFKGNTSRDYILGAIVLAERFREILMVLKSKNIKSEGFAGPSNYELLKDLWKFIDCQTPEGSVNFNFTKQIVMVSERYGHLKKLVG